MGDRDREAVYRSAAAGFAEMADTYDARLAGNPVYLLESTETRTALPDLDGASVADFGCGTGRYALSLSHLGAASVTGIDLSPDMLKVAARKARRAELGVRWEQGDITGALPVPDEAFDAAICALVLSFLPEVRPALTEMARTLRPGGTLIVSDYHPHGLLTARAASAAAGRRDHAPHLRFTTVDGVECRIAQTPHQVSDLFAAARAAGLTLEHMAEPVCDRRLANTHASLREMVGVPLALVLRFRRV
jgi:ubiquinone/menaquinone biosynthesis C-methylase UbiE